MKLTTVTHVSVDDVMQGPSVPFGNIAQHSREPGSGEAVHAAGRGLLA